MIKWCFHGTLCTTVDINILSMQTSYREIIAGQKKIWRVPLIKKFIAIIDRVYRHLREFDSLLFIEKTLIYLVLINIFIYIFITLISTTWRRRLETSFSRLKETGDNWCQLFKYYLCNIKMLCLWIIWLTHTYCSIKYYIK